MLMRSIFLLTLALPAAICAIPPLALSQAASRNPAQASERQLANFKADPSKLLARHPIAGAQMSAIGVGIGQAAQVLEKVDRTLVQAISRKVASNSNGNVLSGYNLGSGDVQTLDVGAAGAAGGGTAGAGVPAGAGSGIATGTAGFFNETTGHTTPAVGSFSTINAVTTQSFAGATVACTQSVSPRNRC